MRTTIDSVGTSDGSTSTRTRPRGCRISRTRRSRATGSPPMPTLPSSRRTVRHRPWPGRRSKTERRITGAPRRRARATAVGEMSRPRAMTPRAAQGPDMAAGAAAHVEYRTPARSSSFSSTGSAAAIQRRTSIARTRPSSTRSRVGATRVSDTAGPRRRCGRGHRVPGGRQGGGEASAGRVGRDGNCVIEVVDIARARRPARS